MVKTKKYVVLNHFKGTPKKTDYKVVEEELPPLKDGEMLVKALWVSVDPYHRAYNVQNNPPYDQFGHQVAVVQESKNPTFPVGAKILCHKGWKTYSVVNPNVSEGPLDVVYPIPDLKGLSESLVIGAVGMHGLAAYFGMLNVANVKSGETVVITAAAGGIGSLAGQIAKMKGCKVIGITGSDEKVQWLQKELGFDKAINYKTADVLKELQAAAPEGVDCYFDNVGGELSSTISNHMNTFGRVCVCGSMSNYNDLGQSPKATILQPNIVLKQLKMQGFLLSQFAGQWSEAVGQLIDWIKSGKLKAREHVTEGFDKIFDAFVGMLAGENIGKAIVKV